MDEAPVFGPVPSRRLGRSLGINNIPPKTCTYSCVYCQLGGAVSVRSGRSEFYEPEVIAAAVRRKADSAQKLGEPMDYLTIVPDGEPTLDQNLGRLIADLRPLGMRIAVITNSSLISRPDVRNELALADWVSLKVDAVSEDVWRRVDRPYGRLRLPDILEGALVFRKEFQGFLATETMLVRGVNDSQECLEEIGEFLAKLKPDVAYIAVPTRPPALEWVEPAPESAVHLAYQVFSGKGIQAEYLIGYEGDAFAASGDPRADILSITAVHPMREDAVKSLLARDGAAWDLIDDLLRSGDLVELHYHEDSFYMRRLPSRGRR